MRRILGGFLAGSIFVGLGGNAFGQMLVQADAAFLQPQIRRDDAGFISCGLRAVAVVGGKEWVEAYDFSVLVTPHVSGGLLKAGKQKLPMASFLKGEKAYRTVMPAPVKFWIAKESEGKALSPTKILTSESPGFILGIADLTAAWKVVMSIMNGEQMQFAVRYENQPVEVVVTFAKELGEAERKPLEACLRGVYERINAER